MEAIFNVKFNDCGLDRIIWIGFKSDSMIIDVSIWHARWTGRDHHVVFVVWAVCASLDSSKTMPSPKLHSDLQKVLNEIRRGRGFNASAWIEQKCKMFNDYMTKCGLSGCVVSLSGGVDSAVTLGRFFKFLDKILLN